jgi:hypothetical protein
MMCLKMLPYIQSQSRPKGKWESVTGHITKWFLVGLLCLVLWPGALQGQSAEFNQAYNRYRDLNPDST